MGGGGLGRGWGGLEGVTGGKGDICDAFNNEDFYKKCRCQGWGRVPGTHRAVLPRRQCQEQLQVLRMKLLLVTLTKTLSSSRSGQALPSPPPSP